MPKSPTARSVTQTVVKDDTAIDYCTNIVRQHDYENFLATLLLTKAIRTPALVIRAFNVEIARIQDQTTDTQTAVFRLQFWKDAVQTMYKKNVSIDNVPANPIAKELYKVCKCYNLPKRHLDRLVTSRNAVLKSKYFNTLEDIEKYAEESVGSIYYLLLTIAGVADVNADHAASHLGKAQGLANILRSIHVANHQKTIYLPMEILMKNKVSQESVLRGVDNEDMKNVIFEVASRANSHLEKARKIKVPRIANQIFLPASSTASYLKKLQKNNFSIFDKSLQLRNGILPFTLYYNRMLNRF